MVDAAAWQDANYSVIQCGLYETSFWYYFLRLSGRSAADVRVKYSTNHLILWNFYETFFITIELILKSTIHPKKVAMHN